MRGTYQDPWGNVGESVNNAVFKYLASRPNPNEIARYQADMNAKNALANKYGLESQILQNQVNAPGNISKIFSDIYSAVPGQAPSAEFVGPMPGSAPTPDVINQRYQQNIPEIMANAMQYGNPSSLGDVFLAFSANAGANPAQIGNAQIGAGKGYKDTQAGFEADPSNRTINVGPGSAILDNNLKEVYKAPFKPEGYGLSITTPDGTVIRQGGGPPLEKPVVTGLQEKDIDLEIYQTLSQNYRKELLANPGSSGTRGNLGRLADSLLDRLVRVPIKMV